MPTRIATSHPASALPPVRLTARWLSVLGLLAAGPAVAQLPDPFLIPQGALRLGFAPDFANYDRLFDLDGEAFPLGALYASDSLGSAYLTTLTAAENAVRSLTGDATFRFHAGAVSARVDADIRRLPFSLGVGLTRRLSFVATVPLVTTRVNATVRVDSTDASAGWNLAAAPDADPVHQQAITTLLAELLAAADALDAGIASGAYGCPSSAQCDQARDLVARVRALASGVGTLTGVSPLAGGNGGTPVPPFAPLATSPAGAALLDAIAQLDAELQGFGIVPLSGSLPLPTERLPPDALDAVLAGQEFGYSAGPLTPPQTVKLSGIGDIEVGLRFGLLDGPAARAVLGATVRLPTGKRDDPANFLDLSNGDRQTDLEWTLDAALEPGPRLGLWVSAAYTLQLPDRLVRRVTPITQPVTPASTEMLVDRDLGDVIRVSVHPALRLAPEFRVFLSATYERRGADRYTQGGSTVDALEALTERETWGFGAGALYRVDRGRHGSALPIEASLVYQAAFYGTGGATPKTGRVGLSLRLFYGLWGQPSPPPEITPSPESGPG